MLEKQPPITFNNGTTINFSKLLLNNRANNKFLLIPIGNNLELNLGGSVKISKNISNEIFDFVTLEGGIASDLEVNSFQFPDPSALSFSITLNYANVNQLNCSVCLYINLSPCHENYK